VFFRQVQVWDRKSAGWDGVRDGSEQNFSNSCGCGAGLNFAGAGRKRTKNFNLRRTLLPTQSIHALKVTNLGKQILMNAQMTLLEEGQDKTFLNFYWALFSLT